MSKIGGNSGKESARAKKNLRKLQYRVRSIKRSFPMSKNEQGEVEFDPDCVAIKVGLQDNYLQEVATGWQYDVEVVNNARKLEYDAQKQILVYEGSDVIARTGSFRSKNIDGVAAFVLDKEGDLYIFEHMADDYVMHVHGAVLGGRPAEMAGIIKIDTHGKINYISNESGHYQPELLDMYRGVKSIQDKMPNIFYMNSVVEIVTISGRRASPIQGFINYMEQVLPSGLARHEAMREFRIQQYNQKKFDLERAQSNQNVIYFDCNESEIHEAIKKLSNSEKRCLIDKKNYRMVLREPGKGPRSLLPEDLLDIILETKDWDLWDVLCDAGVLRNNVASIYHSKIDQGLVTRLFQSSFDRSQVSFYIKVLIDVAKDDNDVNSVKSLLNILDASCGADVVYSNGNKMLHEVVLTKDVQFLDSYFQRPRSLWSDFNARNKDGHTPLDIARKDGPQEIVSTLCYFGKQKVHDYLKRRKYDQVNELLDQGIDLAGLSECREGAIHALIKNSKDIKAEDFFTIFDSLVGAGADPCGKDASGNNIVEVAREKNLPKEIVDSLEGYIVDFVDKKLSLSLNKENILVAGAEDVSRSRLVRSGSPIRGSSSSVSKKIQDTSPSKSFVQKHKGADSKVGSSVER